MFRPVSRVWVLLVSACAMSVVGALCSLLTLVATEQSNPIGFRSGFLVSGVPDGADVPAALKEAAGTIGSPISTAVYSTQGLTVAVDLYVTGTVRDGWVSYDEHGGYPGIVPWIRTTVRPIAELPADRATGYFYLTVSSAEGEPVRQRLAAQGYQIERVADAPPIPVMILTGEAFVGPILLTSGLLVLTLSLHEFRGRRRAVAVRELQGWSSGKLRLLELVRVELAWIVPSSVVSAGLLAVFATVTGSAPPTAATTLWLATPLALGLWALGGAAVHWVAMRSSTLHSVLSRRFVVRREMLPALALSLVSAISVGALLPQLLNSQGQVEVANRLGELSQRSLGVSAISLRVTSGGEDSISAAHEGLKPLVASERAKGRVLVNSAEIMAESGPDLRGTDGAVFVSQAYLEHFGQFDSQILRLAEVTLGRTAPILLVRDGPTTDVDVLRELLADRLTETLKYYGQPDASLDMEVVRYDGVVRLPSFRRNVMDSLRSSEVIIVIPDGLPGAFDAWFARLVLGGDVAFVDAGLSDQVRDAGVASLLNSPESVGAAWNEEVAQFLRQYLSAWFGCLLALGTTLLASWSAAVSWTRVRGRRAVLLRARGRPLWAVGAGALGCLGATLGAGVVIGAWLPSVIGEVSALSVLGSCLLVLGLGVLVAASAVAGELKRQRIQIARTL